jgi:hypothetical protein
MRDHATSTPATTPGGRTTSRITAATGGKSMRSERIAANIAKLLELLRRKDDGP